MTIHFKLCPKPWECHSFDDDQIGQRQCKMFNAEWFRIRVDLETKEGGGKFQPSHSRGYCESEGGDGYIPIKVQASTDWR